MRKGTRFRVNPLQSARFRLKALLLLVFSAICSIFLIGCNVASQVQSDRLVDFIISDPKTFNPVLVSDATSAEVLGVVFNSLLATNGITGNLEPDLAENLPEISKDGLRVVFTLRSGLKWSDGQPQTVDDVIFTFKDVIFNEKIPTGSRDVLSIGEKKLLPKIEKLDDRRIAFTLPEPFAPFLRTVGGVSILPKHILAKSIAETDDKGNPDFLTTWTLDTPLNRIIGSGPYLLSEYRPAERFIYRRNPNYWKHERPYIEKLVLQIVESTDTALLRFRSRELDIFALGSRVKDFQLLKKAETRDKFKIYNGGPATGQLFMTFNLNKGRDPKTNQPFVEPVKSRWFNDVNFRRAVAYAIDRNTMVTNLYIGLGEPQNSPVSVPSPYFFSTKEGLKSYDYDPQKAKQILTEAGYRYNADNRLQDAQGNPVRFTLLTNAGSNPVRGAVGAQIKNDLDKIGITVDFVGIDFNILVSKLDDSRQWDAIVLGFTGGIEPNSSANLWATTGDSHLFNQGPKSGQPAIPGWEVADWEKEIGNLMIKGAREVDEQKRKAVYADYQKLVQEQLPLIHLVVPVSLTAVRDRVQNVKFSALGGALWNLDELKLTAE
ncbi:MAG: ABC transporter substrate-binding protein [Pseudanabaena sp. RU_4_16]|nr:ABC transporter substrate-binding protein [Pseudanabaena sp. SU_2_4]NJM28506.1 ABC transporter substrate-binding protein [Pseudanabaena sp. RU_4_16]NKB18701.1 ABC transporter substrate-binding protein [Pseudanabaena sp. CRU_2_10]